MFKCFGKMIFELGGNNVMIVVFLVDFEMVLWVIVFLVVGMVG